MIRARRLLGRVFTATTHGNQNTAERNFAQRMGRSTLRSQQDNLLPSGRRHKAEAAQKGRPISRRDRPVKITARRGEKTVIDTDESHPKHGHDPSEVVFVEAAGPRPSTTNSHVLLRHCVRHQRPWAAARRC